ACPGLGRPGRMPGFCRARAGSSGAVSTLDATMAPLSDAPPIRVALIDDDSGLLTVLERRLGALRWEIEVLAFPPDAAHLGAMRLHALIVNPRLTGLDYVERVTDGLPGLALLVCSPPVTVSERVRGLRAGADDWITKPCHPEELLARIQAV